MKKLLSFLIVGMMIAMIGCVSAARTVNNVLLDGATSVNVQAGDDVGTTVTVTTTGIDEQNDWESTSWRIGNSGPWNCVDTSDQIVGAGTFTKTFTITIPALTPGTYDFEVKAHNGDGCSAIGESGVYTLNDGVIVHEVQCDAIVTLPNGYGWYNGPVKVDWTYDPENCPIQPEQHVNLAKDGILKYNLVYYLDTATRTYTWDPVEDAEEGQGYSVCLDTDIAGSADDAEGCSKTFHVDTTNPIVYNENRVCDEGDTIFLTADATDYGSGIDGSSWQWDLNNDGIYEKHGKVVPYFCADGPSVNTVKVKVSDIAGNSAGETATVTISNVIPVCEGIKSPKDAALINGEAVVNFIGGASDVEADETAGLIYTWNFGDTSSLTNGNEVQHAYTTAGIFTVTLSVKDKDNGVSDPVCTQAVKIVDPIKLANQEVAAFYPLEADFGEDDGIASFQFHHGITGFGDCEIVNGPNNLVVGDDGGYACGIHWSKDGLYPTANPTNDQRGTHNVLIRVSNGINAEYYSFDITVYSWMIKLNEGWNLISVPLVPEETNTIQNVILTPLAGKLADGYSVYSYQFSGTQSKWFKSDKTGNGDLDNVMPGYGYWIKVKEATVLKGFGKEKDAGAAVPPETQVPTNRWSLIGRYGILGQPWNPSQSPDKRVYGPLDKNIALDSVKIEDDYLHVYTDNSGDISDVDLLYNNEGYWLWVEDDSTHESEIAGYAPTDPYYEYNNIDAAIL